MVHQIDVDLMYHFSLGYNYINLLIYIIRFLRKNAVIDTFL